jgi:VIT1/CCC1 family predicted Fe2+/Mn2+ transporter
MDQTAKSTHAEEHYVTRAGWLRAAVLGANDGLLSTGSLMVGVAAASADAGHLILTGIAGIAAGAMSMAAGEYVSVSSQADAEKADLKREKTALSNDPQAELDELAAVYRARGLPDALACEVAKALSRKDALAAHARDELGITEHSAARPLQASAASALSFLIGGLPPLLVALAVPAHALTAIAIVTVLTLAVLGAVGARLGGAPLVPAMARVVVFGALAMAVTAVVGRLFGAAV